VNRPFPGGDHLRPRQGFFNQQLGFRPRDENTRPHGKEKGHKFGLAEQVLQGLMRDQAQKEPLVTGKFFRRQGAVEL